MHADREEGIEEIEIQENIEKQYVFIYFIHPSFYFLSSVLIADRIMYFLGRKYGRGYREKASGLGCIERFSVIKLP